jgi:hypothetical protein
MKARSILAVIAVLIANAAYAGPPGGYPADEAALIRAYVSEKTAAGRLKYVRVPQRVGPLMERAYRERAPSGKVPQAITPRGSWTIRDGISVTSVKVEFEPMRNGFGQPIPHLVRYFVTKTNDGLKVDWEASTEYSAITWAAFQAQMPTEASWFRFYATLDNYYNYEFSQARSTSYSIKMGSNANPRLLMHAFVDKNSSTGKRLFEVLKDGDSHPIRAALRFLPNSKSNDCVVMERFSEGFIDP